MGRKLNGNGTGLPVPVVRTVNGNFLLTPTVGCVEKLSFMLQQLHMHVYVESVTDVLLHVHVLCTYAYYVMYVHVCMYVCTTAVVSCTCVYSLCVLSLLLHPSV